MPSPQTTAPFPWVTPHRLQHMGSPSSHRGASEKRYSHTAWQSGFPVCWKSQSLRGTPISCGSCPLGAWLARGGAGARGSGAGPLPFVLSPPSASFPLSVLFFLLSSPVLLYIKSLFLSGRPRSGFFAGGGLYSLRPVRLPWGPARPMGGVEGRNAVAGPSLWACCPGAALREQGCVARALTPRACEPVSSLGFTLG